MNLNNLRSIDPETLAFGYKVFGRDAVRRAITPPRGPLIARAKANNDDPGEILRKRDVAVEAILDFVEEYANLDTD